MKARAFNYFRAQSLRDALQAFDRAGGEGCYLAGGQSLVPSLSLRLQAPELLIDISRIESLSGISRCGNVLRVGALTRHAEMLTSPEIARHAPLLRRAAPFVAHPAIRNMGTFGGTIALADPSAEFPAMTLAMDAEFEIASLTGTRTTKADGFFKGLFETGLQPGEILTAISIPAPAAGPSFPPSFADALRQGKMIQAIKIYREVTGVGLKEAKDAVEAIARGGGAY